MACGALESFLDHRLEPNGMVVEAVSDHIVAATSQEGWTEMEGNRVPENTRTYNPSVTLSSLLLDCDLVV